MEKYKGIHYPGHLLWPAQPLTPLQKMARFQQALEKLIASEYSIQRSAQARPCPHPTPNMYNGEKRFASLPKEGRPAHALAGGNAETDSAACLAAMHCVAAFVQRCSYGQCCGRLSNTRLTGATSQCNQPISSRPISKPANRKESKKARKKAGKKEEYI